MALARFTAIACVGAFFVGGAWSALGSPAAAEQKDSIGTYTEEAVYCSDPVPTPKLHGMVCGGDLWGDKECICNQGGPSHGGSWCFKQTFVTLTLRTPLWYFIESPSIRCDDKGSGSCAWNLVGVPGRYFLLIDNPDRKQARFLTSSASVDLRLCAKARLYQPGTQLPSALAAAPSK